MEFEAWGKVDVNLNYSQFKTYGSNMEYRGIFSYSFMTQFGEKFLDEFSSKVSSKILKAAHFVLMELIQNVSFYSAEREFVDDSEYGIGLVKVFLADDLLAIAIENKIKPETKNRFIEKLNYYNSLNADELKEVSRQLRREEHDESKGGGIGLIEILRKSKNEIKYSFNGDTIFLEVNFNLGETNG